MKITISVLVYFTFTALFTLDTSIYVFMFPEIHLWCDTCQPLDVPDMRVSAEVGC